MLGFTSEAADGGVGGGVSSTLIGFSNCEEIAKINAMLIVIHHFVAIINIILFLHKNLQFYHFIPIKSQFYLAFITLVKQKTTTYISRISGSFLFISIDKKESVFHW